MSRAPCQTVLAVLIVSGVTMACHDTPFEVPVGQRNFVVILTDDQSMKSLPFMEHVGRLIGDEGLSFGQYFVTTSLCCPSRVSILTGQYAHNHDVWTNIPPTGSWVRFDETGLERETLAVMMRRAGYRTGFVGKYLNGYPDGAPSGNHVPPGWDFWSANSGQSYYRAFVDSKGRRGTEGIYSTEAVLRGAKSFLKGYDGRPFLLVLSLYAPHLADGQAPDRPWPFRGLLSDLQYPADDAFNEVDVSDKPQHLQTALLEPPQLSRASTLFRGKVESLLAVDAMVRDLIATLSAANLLDQTFVAYTSDNGFHLGEHRLPPGKATLYEVDTRVPFLIRGPGIPRGTNTDALAANIDIAPTLLDLAGLTPDTRMDGVSLGPVLVNPRESVRSDLLLEVYRESGPILGLRSPNDVLVEWSNGAREFYDLALDPLQLENVYDDRDATELTLKSQRLRVLSRCSGSSCR